MGMHHVHLLWVQKHNAMISIDYEVTFAYKKGGIWSIRMDGWLCVFICYILVAFGLSLTAD